MHNSFCLIIHHKLQYAYVQHVTARQKNFDTRATTELPMVTRPFALVFCFVAPCMDHVTN
jgi:hypothetical protein